MILPAQGSESSAHSNGNAHGTTFELSWFRDCLLLG
jgi:hypothetical protein